METILILCFIITKIEVAPENFNIFIKLVTLGLTISVLMNILIVNNCLKL